MRKNAALPPSAHLIVNSPEQMRELGRRLAKLLRAA